MESFTTIVNSFYSLTSFAKLFNLDVCGDSTCASGLYMKLLPISQYTKIFFSAIKLPEMVSSILFKPRLGSTCSYLTALLFKLQAWSMTGLNKVAYLRKLCAYKKYQAHVNLAPLSVINFRIPKKSDLVPNVSNNELNIKRCCSRNLWGLSKLVRNKHR